MNLREIRVQFRDMSGRFDLVDAQGNDTGANFFIQGALRYLNTKGIVDKPVGRWLYDLGIGEQVVRLFDEIRLIHEVFYATPPGSGKRKLVRIERAFYDLIDKPGSPVYYMPAKLDNFPASGLFSDITFYRDSAFNPGLEYNAIVVFPIPNQLGELEIIYDSKHEELNRDTDSNYWSIYHPQLLIMSCMHQLEIFHRNTQGVNDWLHSIENYILNLRQELVHEEALPIDQMEG